MSESPFHLDEREAQARAGYAPKGAGIRDFMPDQHREFFKLLRYIFVGTTDETGWPLGTMLTGRAGFVHSPDAWTLRIDALPNSSDPTAPAFISGRDIGILGIDLSTRRRNRVNGPVFELDDAGFTVHVRQSFGNCAKYIQRREARESRCTPADTETFAGLDEEARAQIVQADTVFVASRSRAELSEPGGIDMSHRGGRPGFIRVTGDILTIPEFAGNRYYNTLGNLLGDPRGSLLLVDFVTGDLLQLQGLVTIHWDSGVAGAVEGAERSWRFEVVRSWRRRRACALEWSFVDCSPATLRTEVGIPCGER